MKAFLKNYHQSPRKVRLVANLIKGKQVSEAFAQLDFALKRAALPIKQLIASAVANAENNFNQDRSELVIKDLRVDKGIVMRRMIPGARGRGYPLKRRTSHVLVLLDVKEDKAKGKGQKSKAAKEKAPRLPEKKARKVVKKTVKKSNS